MLQLDFARESRPWCSRSDREGEREREREREREGRTEKEIKLKP